MTASSGLDVPFQLALAPDIGWGEELLTCPISNHCHTRNGRDGTRTATPMK